MTRVPTHEHEIGIGLRLAVIGAILLVVAVATGIAVESTDSELIDLDAWWNTYVTTFLPGIRPISFLMNILGAGVVGTYVVPLVGAALLALARRPWGAVFFLAASIVGALVVHAPIGLARIVEEWIGWRARASTATACLFALVLLALGLRAIWAVFAA